MASVGFELFKSDEMKGCLIRFWDTDLKKIKFGVCGYQTPGGGMYRVFRIDGSNPPYGLPATQSIRVHKLHIKKNFGKIDYNDFIRENPQWII